MRKFTENHRPRIEFEKEEALALDKEFFRKAFEKACSLQGPQTAYPHRIFEDISPEKIQTIAQMKALSASMPKAALYEYLLDLCAQIARNARLAKHLMDEEQRPVTTEAKPNERVA